MSFILLVFSLAAASASDLGHVAISDSNSDGSILAHVPVTVSSHDDSVIIDDNLDDVAVDDSSIDDGPSVPDDGSSIEVTSCEYSTFAVVYKDVDLSTKTAKAATAARAARGIGGRGRYRTGDVAPIALIVGLLAVSAAGIGFIIYRKKKSK